MQNTIKDTLLSTGFVKDNEYLDKYVKLVSDNRETVAKIHSTQKHHIVPRCVFKYTSAEVDNSLSNVVNLTYCDHLRAHYFLSMCASDSRFISANTLSIRYLLNGKKLPDFDIEDIDEESLNSLYESSRKYVYEVTHAQSSCEKIQRTLSGRKSPNKGNFYGTKNKIKKEYSELGLKRLGSNNSFYGRKHSEDSKIKIALKNGKQVQMLDMESKEVVKEFLSVHAAGEYLLSIGKTSNKSASDRIRTVCNCNNIDFHAYGYSWRYKDKV